MAKRRTLADIQREELRKLRTYPVWRTIMPLVYESEITEVRNRLKASNTRHKIERVHKRGVFVGYRVRVRE